MANFYWRGKHRDSIVDISGFDFNEPSNWVVFETYTGSDDGGCAPYTRRDGKVTRDVQPTRGIGIHNYGTDDEGSGFGWGGASNLCRAYYPATRAPGPGDIVIIGDDWAMGMTPLLFGGFSGDENGGVWVNGADDGAGGYTHAVGTTYNSSLAAFYVGGMGAGHPDFNYPWQRIGGGFTANAVKYGQYEKTLNSPTHVGANSFADFLWKAYFVAGVTGIRILPDGTQQEYYVSTPVFSGVTWSPADLTTRHDKLSIKADYIEEAFRSYTGWPFYIDIHSVKNLKKATDSVTGVEYDRVVTIFQRLTRNATSFISGWFNHIQNLSSNTIYADFNGEAQAWADGLHDVYHLSPDEYLILDGVTAGAARTYISDPIKLQANSSIGSLHLDDNFSTPEDSVWCVGRPRDHYISGVVDSDVVLTTLGLTGTAEGDDLDSKVYIRGRTNTFIPIFSGADKGTFNVWIGNTTGLSFGTDGVTCNIDKLDIEIIQTLPASDPNRDHRPANIKFWGTGKVLIMNSVFKYCTITTDSISQNTPIIIGTMMLGEKAWFYPGANNHRNWYFGLQTAPGFFMGGIQFAQEGIVGDADFTSEFTISPYFRLHNAAVGLTLPSQLRPINSTSTSGAAQAYIKSNLPGA